MSTSTIATYAALARLLGITRQGARKLARSAAWPFGPPPWPGSMMGRIRAHVAGRRAFNNSTADDAGPVPLDEQARDLGMSMSDLMDLHAALDAGDYDRATELLK